MRENSLHLLRRGGTKMIVKASIKLTESNNKRLEILDNIKVSKYSPEN